MINIHLLKQTIKSNYKILLIFTFALSVFVTIVTGVFTPDKLNGIENIAKNTPISAIIGSNNSLVGFISNAFFGMMGSILPMIYVIIIANKLIASQVDKGSMAYILSTPIKRNQVTITQSVYLIGSLIFMFATITTVGIIASKIFQPDALDIKTFILVNIGCLLLHFATSGIAFASSCIFNLSKNSLAVASGIPITFFIFKLVAELSSDLEFFKYFTINTLFDTKAIIARDGYLTNFTILITVGIVLYLVGMKVFKEKDLPL